MVAIPLFVFSVWGFCSPRHRALARDIEEAARDDSPVRANRPLSRVNPGSLLDQQQRNAVGNGLESPFPKRPEPAAERRQPRWSLWSRSDKDNEDGSPESSKTAAQRPKAEVAQPRKFDARYFDGSRSRYHDVGPAQDPNDIGLQNLQSPVYALNPQGYYGNGNGHQNGSQQTFGSYQSRAPVAREYGSNNPYRNAVQGLPANAPRPMPAAYPQRPNPYAQQARQGHQGYQGQYQAYRPEFARPERTLTNESSQWLLPGKTQQQVHQSVTSLWAPTYDERVVVPFWVSFWILYLRVSFWFVGRKNQEKHVFVQHITIFF
ncbi:hypothetical protein EDC01DRAFT_632275 [Geopyxis carbonaria]|nr:hypothetical protein EDC01DRAFT_632275 [Geopyxis carbonaria]